MDLFEGTNSNASGKNKGDRKLKERQVSVRAESSITIIEVFEQEDGLCVRNSPCIKCDSI